MKTVPFDKREGYIWFDGNFVLWPEAKIHVMTHGLNYASCVFEGERLYNNVIFRIGPLSLKFLAKCKFSPYEEIFAQSRKKRFFIYKINSK